MSHESQAKCRLTHSYTQYFVYTPNLAVYTRCIYFYNFTLSHQSNSPLCIGKESNRLFIFPYPCYSHEYMPLCSLIFFCLKDVSKNICYLYNVSISSNLSSLNISMRCSALFLNSSLISSESLMIFG